MSDRPQHPFNADKPNRHPIDVSTLDKGMWITPEECEDHSGKRRGTQEYAFALQSLREYIYRESARNGRPLSCGIKGDGVLVHTDSEAALYHKALNNQAVAAVYRSGRRLAATVDRTQLTDAEKVSYDRSVLVASLRSHQVRRVGNIIAAKEREQKKLTA